MTSETAAAWVNEDINSAPAISLDHVTVRFESKRKSVTAVSDVSLIVDSGQFVCLLGPSGCGKSTLLKAVAGLVRPATGNISIRGMSVTKPRTDIGYVFQQAALLDWRGVRDNILLQAEMRGMDRQEASKRADELIELVGLSGFEKSLPHELSGGMQQRVSICRALLHQPSVLLMDEPFGALDALNRERMNIELHRIWRQTKISILLVTHSISEAVYLAERVVVMSARPGSVVADMSVPLEGTRDYGSTMRSEVFQDITSHLRTLLT